MFLGLLSLGALSMAEVRAEGGSIPTFKVSDSLTLGEISVLLYGTTKKWHRIAEWNGLRPPYHVKRGQVLQLQMPPTVSKKVGKSLLLAMWRERFNRRQPTVLEEKDDGVSTDVESDVADDEYVGRVANVVATKDGHFVTKEGKPLPPKVAEKVAQVVAKQEKRQFLADIKEAQKEEGVQPNVEAEQAKDWISIGRKDFDAKNYTAAIKSFEKAHQFNPDDPVPLFLEIRTYKLLNREADAREAARALVHSHPELEPFPVVQAALQGGG